MSEKLTVRKLLRELINYNLDTIEQLERALENNKKCSKTIDAVYEENQQLRKENKALRDANDGLSGTIAHYIEDGDLK